jgi:dihydroflavonol-4-reductase
VGIDRRGRGYFQNREQEESNGKNYLLSSDNYRISDVTLMLNGKEPAGKPVIVYNCDMAIKDLGMKFKPAKASLEAYNTLDFQV